MKANTIQGKALMLAGGLTAFALVLVLVLTGRVARQAAQPSTAPTVAAPVAELPTAEADPAVQALIDAREAEYQQVIQDANDRLAQANQRLARAQARPPAPVAAPRPAYIGADVAAQIALLAAPGAALGGPPELVNFQGTAAYEVPLNTGPVYVDARTGQVLHNGAVAPAVASAGGGGGGSGGQQAGRADHEDDEHDEGEDHDDDEHEREQGEHEGGDDGEGGDEHDG